jgi:flagellar protein FliO/FliZ
MALPSRRHLAFWRRLAAGLLAATLAAAAALPAHAETEAPAAAASAVRAAATPALLAPPAAAPAHAPEGPSFAPMGWSLVAVLALMAGLLWLLRRAGLAPRAGGAGPLRLVGQLSLGPRERIVIVEAGERWLLLGVGAGGVSRLASLAKGEAPAATLAPANFGALLERLRKGTPA